MEKTVKIINKNNDTVDAKYWATKSAQERIAALEFLRNQMLTKNGIRQRLQRVFKIVERT